ncbi:MAG: tetratricopeptide repeat protein, partial [Planctomycetota bacterium]
MKSKFLGLLLCGGIATVSWAQEEPFDTELLWELLETGEYEDAEEYLQEAPAGPIKLLAQARLLHETGHGDDALEQLTAAKEYQEGHVEVVTQVGALRAERGDATKAEQDFERALERNPEHLEALTRLGLLLITEGQREKGREYLQRIIRYYQKLTGPQAEALSPQAYVWMGKACEGLNRHLEAYDIMYTQALELDEESPLAHLASGKIMLEKYNYPDARSHFKDALKKNPEYAEAHIGLAAATFVVHRFPRNRFQSTTQSLAAADRIWKGHPEALLLQGQLAFFAEDWQSAEDYYRRAIAQNPRDLQRRGYLAALLFTTGRDQDFQ